MPQPRTRPRLRAFLAPVLLGSLVASASLLGGTAPAAAAEQRELVLDLDRTEGGGDGTTVATAGSTPTRAVLRTHGSGRASAVPDADGGRALRLPAFDPGATADTTPMAVLEVTPTGDRSLDPGSAPFVVGASVRMDATSTGSRVDDGDNLVQRGGYADRGQVKVQVDDRRPSCRVKGADGALLVTAGLRLVPDRWYDVRCRRSAWEVELVVTSVEDGRTVRRTWERSGATGWIDLSDDVPLSIGGKVDRRGEPVAGDSDQLNGVVDEVFLDIRAG